MSEQQAILFRVTAHRAGRIAEEFTLNAMNAVDAVTQALQTIVGENDECKAIDGLRISVAPALRLVRRAA